ncbi:hypothetical protein TNCV_994311 [Trichonephila clavipes]|nr:hypothetical protein TNCV_994311 [Trichonephila clavipes]
MRTRPCVRPLRFSFQNVPVPGPKSFRWGRKAGKVSRTQLQLSEEWKVWRTQLQLREKNTEFHYAFKEGKDAQGNLTASCKRLIDWFLLYKETELGRKIVPVRPPKL